MGNGAFPSLGPKLGAGQTDAGDVPPASGDDQDGSVSAADQIVFPAKICRGPEIDQRLGEANTDLRGETGCSCIRFGAGVAGVRVHAARAGRAPIFATL